MNYGHLLRRTARLTWRWPVLWLFGFLATLTTLTVKWSGRWLFSPEKWAPIRAEPDRLFTLYERLLAPGPLIAGLVVLLTAGLLFWLLNAAAEGGLIRASIPLDEGQSITAVNIWRYGRALIVPFVLIDTLLFLPLFLLLLAAMLLTGGGLIALILMVDQGATISAVTKLLSLILSCASALLLLAGPVALLTLLFRLLAFRGAALDGLKTGPAIRQAWCLIRRNLAHVLILMALLWLASTLLNLAVGLPLLLLNATTFVTYQFGLADALLRGLLLLAELFQAWLHALLFVFTAVLWTLAYQELVSDERRMTNDE